MDLIDNTPFATLAFESIAPTGQMLQIVVIRATFDIRSNIAQLCTEQIPVVAADEYFGEPQTSSIRTPNDLAPYKPNTDIIVNAIAYAPNGLPSDEWAVELSVGKISKRLMVTGPSEWTKNIHHCSRSRREPCTQVPITYENAYGGQWKTDKIQGASEYNPVGKGYIASDALAFGESTPAPQLTSTADFPAFFSAPVIPQGFGAIAPAWLSRRCYAGTFDSQWERERAPELPSDFKYDFYNAAHPDLIYDGFLCGGEEVVLKGLTPDGLLTFKIPLYEIGIVITDKAGFSYGAFANLDTFHLDVERKKLALVYRASAPILDDGIAQLEIKLRTEDGKTYG
jgi:hypothetical protein